MKSTATLEHKSLRLKVKDLGSSGGGPGTYEIYCAAFSNVDRANEVIAPGSFENLDDFVKDGFMTINHQWSLMPIATIDRATMDHYGLLVSGTFHSTPEAQAARQTMIERMERGKTVQASIGYVVTKDAQVRQDGKAVRLLKGIKLFEFSWVNVPANPAAVAVSIKSLRSGRAHPAAIRKAMRDFMEFEFRQEFGLAEPADPRVVLGAVLDYHIWRLALPHTQPPSRD